jgi:hypothetical protein
MLYTDFIIHQNLLVLAHGQFLSMIDLNNSSKQSQHILSFKRKNPYDMSPDLHSVIMLDKESTRMDQRWKIIVLYKGSQIKQLVESK